MRAAMRSDEEEDPSILADLKSEQASLRSVLRVLEDDLEEKILRLGTSATIGFISGSTIS